jgi:hypothetical protein
MNRFSVDYNELDEVYEFGKHLSGQHDQSTHGTGKVGIDSTKDLDKLFRTGSVINLDTQARIQKMNEQDISAGRAYGDNALKLVAEQQGFTGTPKTVATVADLKKLQEAEGGTIVYRGLSNYSTEAANSDDPYMSYQDKISYTADQAIDDFKNGEYYAGWGMFGNGTYTSVNRDEAVSYAEAIDRESGKMGGGKTMAMLIPSSALMPTPTQVKEAMKFVSANNPEPRYKTQKNDLGRLLASKGFQAYDSGYVQDDKAGNIVVLDRSMLTVADEVVK